MTGYTQRKRQYTRGGYTQGPGAMHIERGQYTARDYTQTRIVHKEGATHREGAIHRVGAIHRQG